MKTVNLYPTTIQVVHGDSKHICLSRRVLGLKFSVWVKSHPANRTGPKPESELTPSAKAVIFKS